MNPLENLRLRIDSQARDVVTICGADRGKSESCSLRREGHMAFAGNYADEKYLLVLAFQ